MISPVALVPVAPEHADAVQRLVTGSRDILEQTRLPDPYPETGAASWIEYVGVRHQLGEEYAFAITGRQGEVVGVCGLVVQEGRRDAELGYWVGAEYRGRGYASSAAREAVAFAFTGPRLARVYALPLSSNRPSRRVLEKAGLRFVRLQPAEARWPGQEQALYEVTLEDNLANAPG